MRRALLLVVLAGCSWGREWDDTRYLCPDGECPEGQECRSGRCELATGDDAPPWWSEDFTARRPLLIDNMAAEPLAPGMAVGWVHDLDELVGVNHRDLQVVTWTGSEWIRVNTFVDGQPDTQETLWFELDQELAVDRRDSRHWVYYDYVDSPAPPSMDVPEEFGFEVWDSFIGEALDTDVWVSLGDVSVAGDFLVVGPGGQIRTVATWPPGYATDIKVQIAPSASPDLWMGFQRPDDDADDEPLALWAYRGADTMTAEFWMSSTGEPPFSMPDVLLAEEDAEHTFTVVRLADGAAYWHENEFRLRYQLPAGAEPNREPIHVRVVNQGALPLTVERIRVRPAVNPPPALTLGEEETL